MFLKRIFDILCALFGLLLFSPLLLLTYLLSSLDTGSSGLFIQNRIGQFGQAFKIYKIKTLHPKTNSISAWGSFLRKSKLDELPQLLNIINGDMSFVGPRPDVAGYYDLLQGEERQILQLRPGLTSEASLKYMDEEYLLLQQRNPLEYNDKVIFPDKIKMNLEYLQKRSFFGDLNIIIRTITRR